MTDFRGLDQHLTSIRLSDRQKPTFKIFFRQPPPRDLNIRDLRLSVQPISQNGCDMSWHGRSNSWPKMGRAFIVYVLHGWLISYIILSESVWEPYSYFVGICNDSWLWLTWIALTLVTSPSKLITVDETSLPISSVRRVGNKRALLVSDDSSSDQKSTKSSKVERIVEM